MIQKFPSKGNSVLITNDMCDFNCHMNVVYYHHIFEDGCSNFHEEMGFTRNYFEAGYSSFSLETNIRYLKELKEGEEVTPYFRLLKINPKLIYYVGIIISASGDVSSFCEQILAHIDMSARRTSPMPNWMLDKLGGILRFHELTGPICFPLRLSIK